MKLSFLSLASGSSGNCYYLGTPEFGVLIDAGIGIRTIKNAWILAGGTHHSCFSYDLTAEYWEDYAEIAGIEMVHINKDTTISCFKKELRMNEVYYMLNKALC